MNYEQAYKEALKKAKEYYDNNRTCNAGAEYLSEIFPEIAKTEEDKILETIEGIINNHAKTSFLFEEATKEQCIGWIKEFKKSGHINFSKKDIEMLIALHRCVKGLEEYSKLTQICIEENKYISLEELKNWIEEQQRKGSFNEETAFSNACNILSNSGYVCIPKEKYETLSSWKSTDE